MPAARNELKTELRKVIEKYSDKEECDMQSAIRDALTDMRHLCDDVNLSYAWVDCGAADVYDAETYETDQLPEGVEAVCENCGKPCEYDSEMCLCRKCEAEAS